MLHWRDQLQLSKQNGDALHSALLSLLREQVGEMAPEASFPTERELIEATGVSRATVRKALEELAREGWVYRIRGSGTFVASRRLETELNEVLGFNEAARASGREASSVVLSLDLLGAPEEVALSLGLQAGEEVYRLERVRMLDGIPAMVERAHLPRALVPGFGEHDLSGSLYAVLSEKYGHLLGQGKERIFAVAADRRLGHLLQIEAGTPLLASVRDTRTVDGKLIEHTLRHVRPDRCAYLVDLSSLSALLPRADRDSLTRLESTHLT